MVLEDHRQKRRLRRIRSNRVNAAIAAISKRAIVPDAAPKRRTKKAVIGGWSDAEDAFLRTKRAQGWTLGMIADCLPGRTRNACIGRSHRLDGLYK